MSTALADGGRPKTPQIGDLLSVFSIVGTVSYGAGWVFYNAILGQLGLEAEDAGLGTEFLFVRAALAIGILVTAAAVLLVITGASDRLLKRTTASAAVVQLWLTAGGLLFFVVSTGLVYTTIRLQLPGLNQVLALIIGALAGFVLAVITGGLSLVGLGYRLTGTGSDFSGDPSSAHLLAVAAIVVLLALAGVYLAGLQLGQEIVAGRPIRGYVMSLRYVTVEAIPDNLSIDGQCLLRIGARDGVELLYNPESKTLHSVASENVVLTNELNKC